MSAENMVPTMLSTILLMLELQSPGGCSLTREQSDHLLAYIRQTEARAGELQNTIQAIRKMTSIDGALLKRRMVEL